MLDTILLVARLVLGLALAAHGAQKLFGWFGGYGLAGTGGFMESLGFRPGKFFAFASGTSELVGGLLIALGLFPAIGAALVIATMVVAILSVHASKGFFGQNGGYELPLVYIVSFALLAFNPGSYSLDGLLGITALHSAMSVAIVLGLGALGGVMNLALRRSAPAQQQQPAA